MKARIVLTLTLLVLSAFGMTANAHPSYTGYSGAPGSHGRCAASCHGSSGGTVEISGFPTEYTAGEIYTITISHAGGNSIKQFNGSCRVGTGSENAGLIESGTNTVTYNTAVETNGIHFSSSNQNSGTFLWTAPPAGTGEVRLYVAGHQGSYSGQNTTLVLPATEQTNAVGDDLAEASRLSLRANYPNPIQDQTIIGYLLPRTALVRLEIFDLSGRVLESFVAEQAGGYHQITWNAAPYPSGVYFYRIQAGGSSASKRMLISR